MKGKIFNTQEVQAIISGNKRTFREICKRQPQGEMEQPYVIRQAGITKFNYPFGKIPYKVGQKIFCKESFCEAGSYKGITLEKELRVEYKADGGCLVGNWKPAQHMRQEHSRLFPIIKEIRVERLSEISEEDAIAEGIKAISKDNRQTFKYGVPDRDGFPGNNDFGWAWTDWQKTAKEAFGKFWNATHKKPEEKFEASPFVWCVTFEVVK